MSESLWLLVAIAALLPVLVIALIEMEREERDDHLHRH